MRCLVCEGWSFSHICKPCQTLFIVPQPQVRTLECGLKVLSFFSYDELSFLLHTKHTDLGYYVFSILARNTMHPFRKAFKYQKKVQLLPIDDKTQMNYAHTALLTKHMKSKYLRPLWGSLHSQNGESYAGKSLAYRKAHPRNFKLHRAPREELILVDDIVTTGTTLCEAYRYLSDQGHETLMAVVLADADR